MLDSQLQNPPLSDLLAVNGGVDRETGAETILLDVSIVFFGRTLSGDEVQSSPLRKTVQFGR
jgi:3-keto-L-gulonate-6-phosphate decarboxylase